MIQAIQYNNKHLSVRVLLKKYAHCTTLSKPKKTVKYAKVRSPCFHVLLQLDQASLQIVFYDDQGR